MREYPLKKDTRGFSLVELVMLLAIMGILAGFSIPMLNSTVRDMRLIGDARSIATNLTYAKLSAASQTTHYRLSFDVANSQWSTARLNRASGNFETQGTVNSLTNAGASRDTVFKATSSSAPSGFPATSSAVITFNSRGIPIEGPSAIYLSNSAADYAVTVSLAGKVQLLRLMQSQWVSQ